MPPVTPPPAPHRVRFVLIGFLVGVLVTAALSYVLYAALPAVAPLPATERVQTDMTPSQTEDATSLVPGRQLLGTVQTAGKDAIELAVTVPNLVDPSKATKTSVSVPFDPQRDSVVAVTQGANGSLVRDAKASFEDMRVGQQVLVSVGSDGKVFYLTK